MKRVQMIILIISLYGLTGAAFWVASVRSVKFFPYIDSYAWQSVPDANNGGSNNFEITSSINGPKNMRGWMAFNISVIPPDSWIINAELRLRIWHKTTNDPSQGTLDSTGRTYGVYRVTQSWQEYNISWTNQPAYTETHYSTAPVPPGQGGWNRPLFWMEWDLTYIVKDWHSGAKNYGISVRETQEDSPVLISTQFFTHDTPNQSYYPRLIVTYVRPLSVVLFVAVLAAETIFMTTLWRKKLSHSDK